MSKNNTPTQQITDAYDPMDEPPSSLPKTRFDIIIDHDAIQHEQIHEELELQEDLNAFFSNIEKFEEGGQGILKMARDKKLHRYVALKSLKKDFLNKPSVVKKFISEARITAQLDHPSIIPMYGIIQDENSFIHMAMKLVQGRTLRDILKETSIIYKGMDHSQLMMRENAELKVRLSYFVKICEAIAYAHSKKIIHKDLKPENVMIGSFNEVYVMDWGIAKIHNKKKNDRPTQQAKSVTGTPIYIAPEYLLSGHATFSCDQYALGVILHEIVSLKAPYDEDDRTAIFKQTLRGIAPPITHKFETIKIHRELQAIICKAMELDPNHRYATINQLGQDIINYLQKEETLALKDNYFRALIRKLYKHKLKTAIIVLSLLLSFASITIWSLVEQKKTIIQSKKREVALIHFQTDLNQRAAKIDRHFLQLFITINRFSDQIKYFIRNKPKDSQELLFLDSKQFKTNPHSVPGLTQSPLYGGSVSLIRGNYKIPENKDIADYQLALKQLSPIAIASLNLMASSPDLGKKPSQKLIFDALNTGFPIRSMYAGLNTGLLIKFPGTDTINKDYRLPYRFWYMQAKKKTGVFWSAPYIDLFGQGLVISAIKPLRDNHGSFLGAAAIDITFDYIMDKLMQANKDFKSGIKRNRYLIDEEGKIILTNRKKMSNLDEALLNKTEIKFHNFHYPHILPTLKQYKSGQIRIKNGKNTTLIAYSYITTLKWFYIEELDLNSIVDMP